MSRRQVRVFVSSKMDELAEERAVVKRALEQLRVDAWVYEIDAGARPTTIRGTYLDELESADLYIGLFWKSWGEYTFDEYRYATRLGTDCLIYEKNVGSGERDLQLQNFLDEIGDVPSGVTVARFESTDELEDSVQRDIAAWQASKVHAGRRTAGARPFQVPPLGDKYVERSVVLGRLKEKLLPKKGQAGVTRAVLHGLGGSGKSVVAAAFAWDEQVQRHFPDGVLWVTLDQNPQLIQRLSDWGRAIHDPQLVRGAYTSMDAAVSQLRSLLYDRAFLLIVDDAWDAQHVSKAFLIGGPRSLLFVTTRQSKIADEIGAEQIELEPMTKDESLRLMTAWSGDISPADEQTSLELAEKVVYLPLALELIGARVKALGSWLSYAKRLADCQMPSLTRGRGAVGKKDSVRESLSLSIQALADEERAAYFELVAFNRDTLFPAGAAAILWNCSLYDAADLLFDLVGHAVLTRTETEQGFRYRLHDLLYEFVVEELGNKGVLAAREKLLTAYGEQCKEGWPSVPDDGYIMENLAQHLTAAQRADELIRLLVDSPAWMLAKQTAIGTDFSLDSDIELALNSATSLVDYLALYTLRSAIRERAILLNDTDLQALVWMGRHQQALGQVRLQDDALKRCCALLIVFEELSKRMISMPDLLDEAEEAAQSIIEPASRAKAYQRVGLCRGGVGDECWTVDFEKASEACFLIGRSDDRAKAFVQLSEDLRELDRNLAVDALEAGRSAAIELDDPFDRIRALSRVAIGFASVGLPQVGLDLIASFECDSTYFVDGYIDEAVEGIVFAAYRTGFFESSLAERAQAIVEGLEVNRVLPKIAGVLVLSGDRKGFKDVFDALPDDDDKHLARYYLSQALLAEGEYEDALVIAESMPYESWLADAVLGVARKALKIGDSGADKLIDKAVTAVFAIPDYDNHASRVTDLCRMLIRAGRPMKAMSLIKRLQYGYQQGSIIVDLTTKLDPGADFLSEALAIARSLETSYSRSSTLSALSVCLAKNGDDQSDVVFREGLQAAMESRAYEGLWIRHDAVLSRIAFALADEGQAASAQKVLNEIKEPLDRVRELCELAAYLVRTGQTADEIVENVSKEVPTIEDQGKRVEALTSLLVPLGLMSDDSLEDVIREAERLIKGLYDGDPMFHPTGFETPHLSASEGLAELSLALAQVGRFDRALEIARRIKFAPTRKRALAFLAARLVTAGDPRGDSLFVEARAVRERKRLIGYTAKSAAAVIFSLAETGRFEEAIQASKEEIREDDRSRILTRFVGLLIGKDHLSDALDVALNIQKPTFRAEALAELMTAYAIQDKDRSEELLDELRRLADAEKRSDIRSSILEKVVSGLVAIGRTGEAKQVAEAIKQADFRASAFLSLANTAAHQNLAEADNLFERVATMARSLDYEQSGNFMTHQLFESLLNHRNVRAALAVLERVELDDLLGMLANLKPFLDESDRKEYVVALEKSLAIAGWVRPDWRKVHSQLERDDQDPQGC